MVADAGSLQELFGRPFKPGEIIQVQADAIVSRILTKQPGGSITLFAFAAGQGLDEHTAPFDAMICVLEGTAEVAVAGTWHCVSAGEAILLPANVPHAVKAPEAFKMLLFMVRKG